MINMRLIASPTLPQMPLRSRQCSVQPNVHAFNPLQANRRTTAFQSRPSLLLSPPKAAASVPVPEDENKPKEGPFSAVTSLFQVFSNPRCNKKMIALAVGQMLCSIATLIHDSYLPVYVQDVLGLSNTKIGAVQGIAQFLCQLSKGASGVAGDLLGSQVRVLVFGTFLTLLCKPMFALLSSVYGVFGVTVCLYWFFFAKLCDRLSKGIREAPTKAVMNELARESGDSPEAAYALRQSLATAGALVGSGIASFVFAATGQNYIITFAVASIPPVIALLWLMQNFTEELFGTPASKKTAPPPPPIMGDKPPPNSIASIASLDSQASQEPIEAEVKLTLWGKARALAGAFKPVYWQALIVVGVLYFARFDASFLSLRAKQVIPKTTLPLLFLVSSLIQAVVTAPLGKFSGTSVARRNGVLLAGFLVMVAANTVFALPQCASTAGMFAGAALLGLHMAMTHSTTVSMIASYMPTGTLPGVGKLSGTAVSFTDFLLGFMLAASNGIAGVLSDVTRSQGYGNVGCFVGGGAACLMAALLLVLFSRFGDLGREELVVRKQKKKLA